MRVWLSLLGVGFSESVSVIDPDADSVSECVSLSEWVLVRSTVSDFVSVCMFESDRDTCLELE